MMTGSPLSTVRQRQRVLSGLGADESGGWGTASPGTATTGVAAGALGITQALRRGDTGSAILAGVSTAGTGLMAILPTAAIPVVGPIIAGVTIALQLLLSRKGPKQKVATTEIVNAVEPHLKENVQAYLALPVHYASAQALALANFDAGWAYVVSHCNIPEMGNPGIACTADRQRGGQWDWFSYYRDPIASDPTVIADPTPDEVAIAQVESMLGGDTMIAGRAVPTGLLVAGGLAILALSMGGSGGGRR